MEISQDLTTASDRLEAFLRAPAPTSFLETAESQASSPHIIDSLAATASNVSCIPVLDQAERTTPLGSWNVDEERESSLCHGMAKRHDVEAEGTVAYQESMAYGAIKGLFSRAGNLIREASDLEGIIFVNASLQDIEIQAGRVTSDTCSTQTPMDSRALTGTRSSVDHDRSLSSEIDSSPSSTGQSFKLSINRANSMNKSTTCEMLGYSLRDAPCGDNVEPSKQQLAISQSVLRGLLKLYPHGQIFLFDRFGSPIHHDDIDIRRKRRRKRSNRISVQEKRFEKEKEQLRSYQ